MKSIVLHIVLSKVWKKLKCNGQAGKISLLAAQAEVPSSLRPAFISKPIQRYLQMPVACTARGWLISPATSLTASSPHSSPDGDTQDPVVNLDRGGGSMLAGGIPVCRTFFKSSFGVSNHVIDACKRTFHARAYSSGMER